MKRLTMTIVAVTTILVLTPAVAAQSRDLAGSWVLDTDKTGKAEGPTRVILTLTDKEFVAKIGRDSLQTYTFKLDGTELNLDFSPTWARVEQMLPAVVRPMPSAISKNLLTIEMRGKVSSRPDELKFNKKLAEANAAVEAQTKEVAALNEKITIMTTSKPGEQPITPEAVAGVAGFPTITTLDKTNRPHLSITTHSGYPPSSDNLGLPLPSTFHALHNGPYQKLRVLYRGKT